MPSKADLTSSQLEKDAVPGFDYDTLEEFWNSLVMGDFVGFRIRADDAETAAPRFCIAMVTDTAYQLESQERRGSNIFYKGCFVAVSKSCIPGRRVQSASPVPTPSRSLAIGISATRCLSVVGLASSYSTVGLYSRTCMFVQLSRRSVVTHALLPHTAMHVTSRALS